jgi:hypothetical protein
MALDGVVKSFEESEKAKQALEAMRASEVSDLEAQVKQKEVVIDKLSTHFTRVWNRAKDANKDVRLEMIASLQQCKGKYSDQKLAAIRSFKGSEHFIRNAENKARAAESWIKDIYRGDVDLPWDLAPTAMPDLPDETMQEIIQEVQRKAEELQAQQAQMAAQQGIVVPDEVIADQLAEYQGLLTDASVKELQKDAQARCDRAALLIRDQNEEGGWGKAFKEFLWYFTRTKAGIIKGPILSKKKKQVWKKDELIGTFELTTDEVLVPDVYCVSPFNFYPAAGMTDPNDGDVIEIHELTKQSITDLIGVPGYSEDRIRSVIDGIEKGEIKERWIQQDDEEVVRRTEKAIKQEQNVTNLNAPTKKVQAMELWGTVPGKYLIEWGMEGEIDPEMQYQVNCWKIGEYVIKAVFNPDNLGRKPYHISSWAKNPAWIWGEGLVEFIQALEEICNAIVRALVNNIGIASGPQVEINTDRCDDKSPLYPWKRWESTSAQMKESRAIEFYQPQMQAESLINAYQFFGRLMDEHSVPAYAQGASQSGVTAGTATVFTQLLAAASRSIKAVVANIDDDIITPYISMCYDYNMRFSKDPTVKGDARVVAKGVAGLLAREQAANRKTEFLNVTANPVFSQVLGTKNIAYMLKEIAKANDLNLPDEGHFDKVAELMDAQAMGALMGQPDGGDANGQVSNGGTPSKSTSLNMIGDEMGSPELQRS